MDAARTAGRDAPDDPLRSAVHSFLKPALTGMASRRSGGSLAEAVRQTANAEAVDPAWMIALHDDLFSVRDHQRCHQAVSRLHATLGLAAERLSFVDGFDVVAERFLRAFAALPGTEVDDRLRRHLAGDVIASRPREESPGVHLYVTAAANGAVQGLAPHQAGAYLPELTTLVERDLDGRFAATFDGGQALQAIWKGAQTERGRSCLEMHGATERLRTVLLRSLWSHQGTVTYPGHRARAFAAHAWCSLAGLAQRVDGCLTNVLKGTNRLPHAIASGRPAIQDFLASLSDGERSLLVSLGMQEQSVVSCHAIGVIARTGSLSESA
jgi:hypothetical protein